VVPTLGSIVQNGKFAACAFALLKQLNKVDFPTLGNPTIPHFSAIDYINRFNKFANIVISKPFLLTSQKTKNFSF
jgi:hypothetical protein